jgi:hypothetical protein
MTAWAMSPVRISSPPMTIGISTRSPAIEASLAFRRSRSGDPGAYDRTGSFTAGGTRRIPLNPVSVTAEAPPPLLAAPGDELG